MTTNPLCTQWVELPEEKITADKVGEVLGAIPSDDWVVAAAADKIIDNVDVQRAILIIGLERTKSSVERSRKAMLSMAAPVDDEEREDHFVASEDQLRHSSLVTHFTKHTTDELLCQLRAVLLERLDRLETYIEMYKEWMRRKEKPSDEPEDGWDDIDPWDSSPGEDITEEEGIKQDDSFHISLSGFLQRSILHTALFFALNLHFGALGVLFRRHANSLNAHRLYILQSIPEYAHPSEYHTLLPAVDPSTGFEIIPPDQPWRGQPDWTETEECVSAFGQGNFMKISPISSLKVAPHSAAEISHWYQERISQADNAGLVDVALALVQHGASQGVSGLDNLGEELGLLARLIYDAPRPSEDGHRDDGWTLSRWRTLDPSAVVRAYLVHATPETIVDNIRRLVMPYIFVLESREERAGKPDPDLVNRLFYEYVLQTPLELAVMIFEASKPTLLLSERLIKNNEDMARLALACLYGSDDVNDWSLKSRMFECLPEWSDVTKEDDEALTTLLSLGDFVKPSVVKPRCTPQELFLFFSPLPAFALSRILDVLDVHLESGEILARWNVSAPLRWFLLSANDEGQQRAWATRMSRRAGDGGDELETEEEWLELLEDMLKLVGGGEGALRGAFGLLSKEEVTRFFFGGLLSSGGFRVAKSILGKSLMPYLLDPQIVEDQVLTSSREFYDNATSGNINQGEMKLAYECLTVAPPSPAIQKEREFIEATSRICSFNIVSRQGIPISPIEIRLVKDRLSLVARVLSSTADAYKHAEVILDLVHKLGYRGDVAAEVKTFAMLADAALQAEDFVRAAETAQRMVTIVRKLGEAKQTETEAREVCWRSCFQLGRQTEFRDVDTKLSLLGHALELCPPEHMLDVVGVWRKIEAENIRIRRESLVARKDSTSSRRRQTPASATASFLRLQELQFGSSTGLAPDAAAAAALASRTLRSVAASFPFSVRGKEPEDGHKSWDAGSGGGHSPDVSTHAKQALARGIGWLIGAGEEQ